MHANLAILGMMCVMWKKVAAAEIRTCKWLIKPLML